MFLDLVTRLISISELTSQQHLPCVSNLSWSTNQQRAWVKEAELSLPGNQALQRVHLLLTGCLEEGQAGGWRLRDTSGSVRCEVGAPFCCLWVQLQWTRLHSSISVVSLVRVFLPTVAASSCLPPSLELHPRCLGAGAERRRRTRGTGWFSCPSLSCSWPGHGAHQSSRSERSGRLSLQQVCLTCHQEKKKKSTLFIPQRGNACFYALMINTRFKHGHRTHAVLAVRTLSGPAL